MEILQTTVFQRWEQNLQVRKEKTLTSKQYHPCKNARPFTGLSGDLPP